MGSQDDPQGAPNTDPVDYVKPYVTGMQQTKVNRLV